MEPDGRQGRRHEGVAEGLIPRPAAHRAPPGILHANAFALSKMPMPGTEPTNASSPALRPGAGWLRAALESLVLVMVALAPWAYGSVHAVALFGLYVGTSLVLLLWAAVLLAERRVVGVVCPVLGCLAGLVLLGVWQTVPLPAAVLQTVAPETAETRARLMPTVPESLSEDPPARTGDATISYEPGATRREIAKLLALLALFGAVRCAVATPASFRRFAVVCVANGTVLSVFALAQKFSSGPQTVYWSFETQGSVFGPFVCKNHFPYYVNVCFGLGLGLLLGSHAFRGRRGARDVLSELGRNSAALWLVAALGLMLAATAYSLSRGGLIALVGAGVGCGLLAVVSGRRGAGLAAVAVIVGAGVGLVGWFGADVVEKRLGTLGSADALDGGRRDTWARTLPLALRHPVWGTGQGTFVSAEPPERRPGDANIAWEHAHNDYLELFVENGLIGLALGLMALGLVFRAGVRAHRRFGDSAAGWLALGGLFGLTAVALHSVGDFGLHMPAIALLVAVLAGQLVAAEGASAGERGPHPRGGWAVVPVVVGCLVAAAVLPADGWRRARAEYYRLAAVRVFHRAPQGERGAAVEYLRAALGYTPDDAELRLYQADLQYEEYLARRAVDPGAAVHECLIPALRDYLLARAANPLLGRAHARLAGGRGRLRNPDTVTNYLERAARLAPIDGELWYLLGRAHLDEGAEERAWDCWSRSLQCSPDRLESILGSALAGSGPADDLARVLPPNPDLLARAAKLPPLVERPDARRAVLDRVLELLGDAPAKAEGAYLRAWSLRETGRGADAVPAYERALMKAPDRVEWRYELAELCFERGDLAAAAEHAQLVLRDRPDHRAAGELNGAVVRARIKVTR